MEIAKCCRFGAVVVSVATFTVATFNSSPEATAQGGMVEVYYCVVDQTGQPQGNVPVQLEIRGADGNWYVQDQGGTGAGSGCTSFYRQPAPAMYRVHTVAANTGNCQGSTPEAYAMPGPQLNIGNLTLTCVIQPSAVSGPVWDPTVEVWLDHDLDGVGDSVDRWPGDPSRY